MDYSEQLDYTRLASLSIDQDQCIVSINAAFRQNLGYTINGLQGAKLESLLTRSSRIFYQIYFLPMIKLNGEIKGMQLSFKSNIGESVPMTVDVVSRVTEGQEIYNVFLAPLQQKFDNNNGEG
ncbi:PAS domain S-box protein [Paenibacillus sp. Marseille-P2973]|uniref:PAS domain S-box protein n=1 Tax=Paenibacillus sp. Marseille-P2973 TaxID=1871032 RepID=UPI001B365943|nr:PAS domain S-box protein [Paenibacillus sp. Marseille-P2973]MBQ4899915.1 PAS domain S-box protein [Paenibacillus sp. Marseille-P2973]